MNVAWSHELLFFLIRILVCQHNIVLSRPPTPIYLVFCYSRSISIDMGVPLTLRSHMGPGVRLFQTNIQILVWFGHLQQQEWLPGVCTSMNESRITETTTDGLERTFSSSHQQRPYLHGSAMTSPHTVTSYCAERLTTSLPPTFGSLFTFLFNPCTMELSQSLHEPRDSTTIKHVYSKNKREEKWSSLYSNNT